MTANFSKKYNIILLTSLTVPDARITSSSVPVGSTALTKQFTATLHHHYLSPCASTL